MVFYICKWNALKAKTPGAANTRGFLVLFVFAAVQPILEQYQQYADKERSKYQLCKSGMHSKHPLSLPEGFSIITGSWNCEKEKRKPSGKNPGGYDIMQG